MIFANISLQLKVTPPSIAGDLEIVCGSQPVMTSKITKIRIYGHSKDLVVRLEVNVDLCTKGTTIVNFVEFQNKE